jgi:hypothetical protein
VAFKAAYGEHTRLGAWCFFSPRNATSSLVLHHSTAKGI